MAKKKKNIHKKPAGKDQILQGIFRVLDENPDKAFSVKQLAYRLGLQKKKDRQRLQDLVELMVEKGKISEPVPWKYQHIPKTLCYVEGTIEFNRNGAGFVSVSNLPEDVYIPSKKTLNSLNGDTVKVLISHRIRKGQKMEGEVVEVLERKQQTFVGVMEVSKNFAFLVPDNPRIPVDFYIPVDHINGAKNGEKVVIEMADWPEGKKNPYGRVIRILGKAGEHNVEIHSIIEEFGLPYEFSENLEELADKIESGITAEEITKRKDFRDTVSFTIDPFDAKDFDDAISVRKLRGNVWEIGVHIADVTHYLKPGTPLDKEAYKRATSVYLVDRTIPMLPEKLSNFLCSLRPDEEKLCFSAVFNMDENGTIHKEWFGKSIIKSGRRFTYEEVQKIIESGEGDFAKEILVTHRIASKLREKRFSEGAFSFETEEVKFRLDEEGKPMEIVKKIRNEAHMLIEDLMLLANRKVAELVAKDQAAKYPFVYRVHHSPDKEKLANFSRLAGQLGYQINLNNDRQLAQSFNILLKEIEGKPEQNFLESLAIRSMAKAFYTPENDGHFGLAFDYYTHFTSPIRRYSDVMVHRILFDYLKKRRNSENISSLPERCKHSSEREINAENAERASIKYKQVEYMTDHINKKFQGIITGVAEHGIYVEIIENKCEGMVSMRSMEDDYYLYDEDNYLVRGFNTGKVYKLGQVVIIRVSGADVTRRLLDFEMIG